MPLNSGQHLAHYLIDRKIGEGGMGEVWAATDTRLNRAAAIKALPADVAADPDRLARFNREAQLLAALSHPNIAAIYGLEQVGDATYLALELVEGADLSTHIEGRAVPVDEAIEIALQIAAALEEAHDKGIIHRDLKPANIKIAADGKVKVLDFGLAKALSADPTDSQGSLELSHSPTMTAAMGTQAGLILGTAGYMAPEQARGKPVDRRGDIWAFGVILFEMLTGERLFKGETITDIIASVVTREPEWGKLPDSTPTSVRRLLRRCLQQDPRKRLRDIGDAALELNEHADDDDSLARTGDATTHPGAAHPGAAQPATIFGLGGGHSRNRIWLIGILGLLLGLIGAVAVQTFVTPDAAPPSTTWSNLSPPPETEYVFGSFVEISPDGRRVVFAAKPADGGDPTLWVRDLHEEAPHQLAGTEKAKQPFWSPDSRSIAYFAGRKLRRIDADGGVSKVLADIGVGPRGGCWGADDTILYVPSWSHEVLRIPASGGTPEAVTQFNKERLELSHRWPRMLPDGKHFLFFIVSTYPTLNPQNPSEADKSGLYLGSFDGTEPRLLTTARSRAAYTGGSLLYVDDGVLLAHPFDMSSLSFAGEPLTIAAGVTQSVTSLWGGALFSVSDEGTLLFVRGAPELRSISEMRFFDREGNDLGAISEPEPFNNLRLSHDGRRVATSIGDPGDLWIHDVERKTATRFTFDPGNDARPIWSPADDQVLFESSRVIEGKDFSGGNLFRKSASGLEAEEHLATVKYAPTLLPTDWTPDGSTVLITSMNTGTGADIMLFSVETASLEPYIATNNDEQNARFSPDGHWLAYESLESGGSEIFVQAFPGPGGKWQLSKGGGSTPAWREDGKELFYIGPDSLMAVSVETEGGFRHAAPVRLFDVPPNVFNDDRYSYDAAPDGQRFLFLKPADTTEKEPGEITFVQGWRGLLE